MHSEELLELTASEPLSMEEEQDMQRKWHVDDDKLTFILLERPVHLTHDLNPLLSPDTIRTCRMVGDVNMFMPNGLDEEAECEIMIASKDDRRKGFALEALTLFLTYAITTLGVRPQNLIAKIGSSNTPSIRLFEKLGFSIVKRVEVWDEVELRWQPHQPEAKWEGRIPEGRIGPYDAV